MDPIGTNPLHDQRAFLQDANGDESVTKQEVRGVDDAPPVEEMDFGDLPSYLSGPQDPARMQLTTQERQWAVSLKSVVESDPELDNLSDYMYAQISIVQGGDTEKGLEQAHRMQNFRQEYGIRDTLEDGKETIQRYQARVPCHLLHFCYVPPLEAFGMVTDLSKLDPAAIASTWEGKRAFASCFWYIFHAENIDLESARKGYLHVTECKGYRWKAPNMVDLNFMRWVVEEVMGMYPLAFAKVKLKNAGAELSTLVSVIRRFAPKSFSDVIEVEHHADVTMGEVCLVPNAREAERRLLRDLTVALWRRYANERTFRL